MSTRLGIDVGGTFTDLVLVDDEDGSVLVGKVPTSPSAPERGVLEAIAETVAPALLARAGFFVHGTTVGLNALLERRGATVGLLATRGFRDVLEVRRGDRDEPYSLTWHHPPSLVPRRLRCEVSERVLHDGSVRLPLEPGDVAAAAALFAAEGVDAVAIAFLHAYANPEHELAAERLLRAAGFAGDVSLSHRISGEYREYERTTTTVVDAFVRRRLGPYLGRLEAALRERGFAGDALMTRCGGGAMTFTEAADRPFETILSGPVAGASAVAGLARDLGLPLAIGADVGGTSFDTVLVEDGRLPVLYQGSITGLPLQTPWVDVRSIGAGGGSVAFVDAGGLLRVGPRSAGSSPGPAAYGRGGSEPTVTDAAVVLGMLPSGAIAGGVTLDRDAAETALAPLSDRLGMGGAADVARGIMRIAAAGMAGAIRGITVEQGIDPRGGAIVAFGGAGPLVATLLADELDIGTIVVPPYAGNFSAMGMLSTDLAQAASRTRIMRLDDDALVQADTLAQELFGTIAARERREVHLDLRYVGQEHTLTVDVPVVEGRVACDAAALRAMFDAAYQRTFAITMHDEVEIVTVRAIAHEALPRRTGAVVAPVRAGRGSAGAWSFTRHAGLPFALVARSSLGPSDQIRGPAIVTELTSTTYLDVGFTAVVHPTGSLVITREHG